MQSPALSFKYLEQGATVWRHGTINASNALSGAKLILSIDKCLLLFRAYSELVKSLFYSVLIFSLQFRVVLSLFFVLSRVALSLFFLGAKLLYVELRLSIVQRSAISYCFLMFRVRC